MDFPTEAEPETVDFKSLAGILTEMNLNVQSMLRLIEDSEPESTEKFLCLYQSLGEAYNDLNQELLKGLLKFDFNLSSSDQKSVSSLVASTSSSCKPDISPYHDLDLESGAFCSSLKLQEGRTTSSQMLQSLKQNSDVDKNQSAFLFADIFCAELDIARRELEARNIDTETEKSRVLELESKLSDSTYKVEKLESELKVIKECIHVPEAEVSKLMETLNECKTKKAKLQSDNADDLLDSLRAELRSREIQIEQMEEYINQVCVKDTEIMSDSVTNTNTVEKLRAKVEELEKQVELQRNVITEREEEKREAIRQLCFSLDHYMNRYLELVRSLSDTKNTC